MVESRWFRRAGPGIAAIGVLALVASSTLGAPARSWRPDPCPGQAHTGTGPVGTWYRIDPTLADGARTGQRLTLGRLGASTRAIALDAESFAAGPFDGTVLVGTDDGRASHLSLVDVTAGCSWSIDSSSDVVRHATMSPDRAAIYEFRVDRSSRADLGVWRRSLEAGGSTVQVLDALAPDARFGPTWLTSLSWDEDGHRLVVESCAEVACRMRLFDPVRATVTTLADPEMGDIVGVSDEQVVAYAACRGMPCALLSMPVSGGPAVTLDAAAGAAVMSRDEAGGTVVVLESGLDGRTLREVATDGRRARDLPGPGDGLRLVAGPGRSDGATELAPGWLVFAADGRMPLDGPVGPALRHIPDGLAVPIDEVER
jgi:hypothetical protein